MFANKKENTSLHKKRDRPENYCLNNLTRSTKKNIRINALKTENRKNLNRGNETVGPLIKSLCTDSYCMD